jgi:hypothetical protein
MVERMPSLLILTDDDGGIQGCQMANFHTKNPNLGNFVGPRNGKGWYILCHLVYIYYGHLEYIVAIW